MLPSDGGVQHFEGKSLWSERIARKYEKSILLHEKCGCMPHIAVLTHQHDSFEKRRYWLTAIVECWREKDIRVSIVNDPRQRIDADLAFLHVNLTVTPRAYLAWTRRFPVIINGAVSDISKRAISRHLLRREDRYDGPVIVKTNRNCAGHPEAVLAGIERHSSVFRDRLDHLLHKFRRHRHKRRYGSAKAFHDYPVFDSMAEVPAPVWGDRHLVVERFLPERINDRYCIRTWLFLGDHERHALFFSNDPVIKSHNIIDFERLGEVPDELRQIRRELKFDYGKFDYTMVDGRPVLFDANRTPTIGRFPKARYLPLAETLAGGLDSFLQTSPG